MCQPKFLPESPRPTEASQDGCKKRKAPSASTNRTRVLSLEELQENFHLPINEVACKLGVCVTVLKQQCRELGIVRWPYRKVRKLDNMLNVLESSGPHKARPFALTNGEDERQRKICTVRQTLRELISDPNSCAHLKLGKVKHASASAPPSEPHDAAHTQGILERLGALKSEDDCSGDHGEKANNDQAVLEAAQALMWGPHSMIPSEASVSWAASSTQDLHLLDFIGGSASASPEERESKGVPSEDDRHALSFSLGQAPHSPATPLRPKKDLNACWLLSFSHTVAGNGSGSGIGKGATELHLASGAHASFSSSGASSCMDAEDSVVGDRAHSGAVELDLISRLDSPQSKAEAAPEAEAGVPGDQCPGEDNAAIDASPPSESEASVALVQGEVPTVAPAQLFAAHALPTIGIPVPYPCALPCLTPPGAPMTSADVIQFQSQHQMALRQHQQQQQLLAFLGYPASHQITPALLNTAVEAMNAQRHALMASHYAHLNASSAHSQAAAMMGAMMPPKGASC